MKEKWEGCKVRDKIKTKINIESGYTWSRNWSIREDMIYVDFAMSIYSLALMKCYDLNVEKHMRVKIRWGKHKDIEIRDDFDRTCLWKYGMNSAFIHKTLTMNTKREDIVKEEVQRYFEYCIEKDSYILRSDDNEEIKEVGKFLENNNDTKKCFENALKKLIICE